MAYLTAALDRLNVRTAVEDAMNALKCPDKNSLQTQARVVARALEAEFEGFEFQERGSLWSPHVRYVSDADVHLYGSRRAGISAAKAGDVVDAVTYARDVLGLEVSDAAALADDVEAVMQARSRRILKDMRLKIARGLNYDVKGKFLNATKDA